MDKIRTPEECSALIARQKEYEKNSRTTEFNKSVAQIVELVRAAFIGKSCVIPLKIVYRTYNMNGDPSARIFVVRDKEVINDAVDILREEFREAGWSVAIYALTPLWPFTTKIAVSLHALQYINRPGKR